MKTIYPPKYKWIVESEAIHKRWAYYIEEGPQPDKREKCHSIIMHNPAKLQLDIGFNSSAVVRDKETKELVMIVIRNFLGNSGLLSFLGGIIKDNIDHRKNMRVCIIFKPFVSYSPLLPACRSWQYCSSRDFSWSALQTFSQLGEEHYIETAFR